MKNKSLSAICIAIIIALVLLLLVGCSNKEDSQAASVDVSVATTQGENAILTPSPEATQNTETTITPDATGNPAGLDPVQLNSVNMLNYLTVIAVEIIESSNNRLHLEDFYSLLVNYTKPSEVNPETKDQLGYLRDAIKQYRQLGHKRDRLLYAYQQNKAQRLRMAIPNPIALLSAAASMNWKKEAVSAIYLAIDAVTSYKSFIAENELQYLLSDWELDDTQEAIFYNLRDNMFDYLVDMTNNYSLPDDLTLNENAANEFVQIKNEDNPTTRIVKLKANKETYKGLSEYWLLLAKSYYEHAVQGSAPGDYKNCIDALDTYLALPVDILRKDINLAKVLPMAITSAQECMSEGDYIQTADNYTQMIIDNTEDSDWELRYFAAMTLVELYGKTNDIRYLERAYEIGKNNVAEIINEKTQQNMNSTYVESVKTQPVPTPKIPKKPTYVEQQKIDDATAYNNLLEEERKVALPPVYEPLLLNCELLLSLSEEMDFTANMNQELNEMLHPQGQVIFLVPAIDNLYWYGINREPIIEADIEMEYMEEHLQIPAKYISDGFSIKVKITNPDSGETTIMDEWSVEAVERKEENNIETYVANLSTQQAKDFKYVIGMDIGIEITAAANCNPQILHFSYKVINAKDVWYKNAAFWSKDYNFLRN